MQVEAIQEAVWCCAEEHGWHEDSNEHNFVPAKLVMIHSEVTEALEEYRKTSTNEWEPSDIYYPGGVGTKPEGFGVELADVIIRVLDLAEELGINMSEQIAIKHAYNQSRPYRHGNKRV